jgi:hypothetical protein
MKVRLGKLTLGSANVLDLGAMPGAGNGILHAHDPARVKEVIGLTRAADAVFPYLKTGVRFWTFSSSLVISRARPRGRSAHT